MNRPGKMGNIINKSFDGDWFAENRGNLSVWDLRGKVKPGWIQPT